MINALKKREVSQRPEVYRFQNYRVFLNEFVRFLREYRGLSYRAIASRCQFASPNYLQLIIKSKKNLSEKSAKNTARGLNLDQDESDFFINLVLAEHGTSEQQLEAYDAMRRALAALDRQFIDDKSIHESWLHQVVFETIRLKDFEVRKEYLSKRLGHLASPEELEESLRFLVEKGWIVTGENKQYSQRNVSFKVTNDIRRLDVQRCHLRFLDAARHRFIDDLDKREFQGMTLAIPSSRHKEFVAELRTFMDRIHEKFQDDIDCDEVYRLQLAFYRLTKSIE